MSRVGKNPVSIPAGVEVKIDGAVVTAKGKLGEQSFDCGSAVKAEVEDGAVKVTMIEDSKFGRSMWGTARSRIQNLVTGVSEGFERKLEIVGVGYRSEMKGNDLVLHVGYSHPVTVSPPTKDTKFQVEDRGRLIIITGIDKAVVGEVAANIRKVRKPEPYKGRAFVTKVNTFAGRLVKPVRCKRIYDG